MFAKQGMDQSTRTPTLSQVRAVCTQREPTGRVIIVIVTGREEKRERERERRKRTTEERRKKGREKERQRDGERERREPPSSPCVGSKRFRVYRQTRACRLLPSLPPPPVVVRLHPLPSVVVCPLSSGGGSHSTPLQLRVRPFLPFGRGFATSSLSCRPAPPLGGVLGWVLGCWVGSGVGWLGWGVGGLGGWLGGWVLSIVL